MSQPLTGSCQCGGVKYRLRKPPKYTAVCHCSECQKLSSSAFSLSMVVDREDLEVDGPTACFERSADSGAVMQCFFCPVCGNRIFHDSGPTTSTIRLKGTLDQRETIQPLFQIWSQSQQPWIRRWFGNLELLPAFPTQPEDRAMVIRRIVTSRLWMAGRITIRVFGWVCIGVVLAGLLGGGAWGS